MEKKLFRNLFLTLSIVFIVSSLVQAQDMLVSGAGSSNFNGVYTMDGTANSKPHYTKSGSPDVYLYADAGGRWILATSDLAPYYNSYYFINSSDATPPASGWSVNLGSYPAPAVAPAAPMVSYSGTQFSELVANNGSIDNSSPIIITHNNFGGATFTGSNGEDFVAAGKATVSNLPSGLTLVATRTSSTSISLSITGSASSHANANDVNNLTIAFQNTAFSGNNASAVTNAVKNNLVINFSEQLEVGTGQTYTTIASALAAATSGDILNLAAETFTEYGLTVSNKSVRIKGQGAGATIIQAAAASNTASDRVLTCTFSNFASTNELTLQDLTLRNGKKAKPFEVSGSQGGGVFVQYAVVTIKNCEFTGNVASVMPPHGWYGEGGGALCVFQSNLTVENSTFADNVFSSANRTGDWMGGGAILFMGDNGKNTMKLTNCTFSGNTSSVYGGAVFAMSPTTSSFQITNCTFANNSAVRGGAYSSDNNTGSPQPITFTNTLFYGNTASEAGSQMWAQNATTFTFDNCLLQSSGASGITGTYNNCVTGQNPLLGSLANNGGNTRTFALQAGSPAINAGTSVGAPEKDQRGYFRLNTPDIGALESDGALTLPPNVAVYLTSNSADVNANVLYPKVGFGSALTTPFAWSPVSPDWTYKTPKCTVYVVPTGTDGMVASSFVVAYDPALATLQATAGDNNLFTNGIFYTQATASGRLKINASNISSGINVTPGSGKYLARLIFTMLKPGNLAISLDSLDFRKYDTGNNQQVALTTSKNSANVKFYLGDFASSSTDVTGDGTLDINDLSLFATAYWSNYAQASTLYKSKFDIGPTSASGNYFALPTPDGTINFEDLVIFSIGYGKALGGQLTKQNAGALNISFGKETEAGRVRVPVVLSGNVSDVRAFSLTLKTGMKLVGVEKAGALNNEHGFVMFKQENESVTVDAAIIGNAVAGISKEGTVAYLIFENSGSMDISNIIIRNSNNENISTTLGTNGLASALPQTFELRQNYPNPFNPATTISFALPAASKVTLKIYNSLGQEVSTLINNELFEAGSHVKSFDASGLASGMYIYKISSDKFSAMKKMVLMK